MVLVIFPAETTFPVRIRPRIETSPVKGHFLSVRGETKVESRGGRERGGSVGESSECVGRRRSRREERIG